MSENTTDTIRAIVDTIRNTQDINLEQLSAILDTDDREAIDYLQAQAREVAQSIYGNAVYMRGLIEFSNHCRNNCPRQPAGRTLPPRRRHHPRMLPPRLQLRTAHLCAAGR